MSITLYHNPRCSKSRAALQLLQSHGVDPVVVLYLERPLNAAQLSELLQKLKIDARALLRRGEVEYRELNLAEPALSDQALIDVMVAHPRLIERPIAVAGTRAVVGRPPERVLELLV